MNYLKKKRQIIKILYNTSCLLPTRNLQFLNVLASNDLYSTNLDLPECESEPRFNLGDICVSFMTQTETAASIIKGVLGPRILPDLDNERSSSREKTIPSGSHQYYRLASALASCLLPLIRFRDHRFNIDDGCPV